MLFKAVLRKITLLYCVFCTQFTYGDTALPLSLKDIDLSIAIDSTTYNKRLAYLEGDVCANLTALARKDSNRPLADIILICRAFLYAGYSLHLQLVPSPSYSRSLEMVLSGRVHSFAGTVWSQELLDVDVYASEDVIRSGEFEKGIYTIVGHELLDLSSDEVDVSRYKGMTFHGWIHDWRVMNELTPNVAPIVHVSSQFKMLEVHRADFIFLEFSSNTALDYVNEVGHYKPVTGVKISIPDSRKFIVSKSFENSHLIYNILNQGLVKMRANDEVVSVYTKYNVISEKVRDWRVLNTQGLAKENH